MMVNDGWLRMGLIMGSIMGLYIWLVVTGTMEFWTTFHNIWEFHHPNWRSPSFFRGVGQPPSWIIYRIILPVDELIFFIRWLLHHQPERAATLCNVCKMHGLENARYLYRCSLNFIVHWFCWSNGAPADCCIFLCFFFSLLSQSFHMELMAIHFQQRYHGRSKEQLPMAPFCRCQWYSVDFFREKYPLVN